MTTSGTINSTMLASEVIAAAMQDLGVLSAGENPTGEETVLGLRALNWMLKSWQSRGLTSWRDTDGTITVPAGEATATLPYCLDVMDARYVQSQGYERPLQRWELGQYRQIPNKGTRGYPTTYTIAKTDNGITMMLWPVPLTDAVIAYSYTRVTDDVTDAAQTIDIPQEWLEAVYLGLATRLAPTFGVTRVDPGTAQMVAQRAAALEQLLLDADRPSSIYMGAEYERAF